MSEVYESANDGTNFGCYQSSTYPTVHILVPQLPTSLQKGPLFFTLESSDHFSS